MSTMTLIAPPLPPQPKRRSAFSMAVVTAHGILLWAALETGVLERAMAQAAPLMVHIVAPTAAPAPTPDPAPRPTERPRIAPPPVAAVAVPEVPVVREALPEPVSAVAVAPSPSVDTQPAAPAAATPAPPSIRQVAPSALRYRVEPPVAVPLASRRLRESGTVVLRVVVDVHGQPRSVTLRRSSGYPRLDEQALGAMRQARFVPCIDGGQPVECESDAPIVYELQS